MEREPKDFERPDAEDGGAEMDDAAFDAWMEALGPAPGILHVDDEDPEGDARAEADIAAGRCYPHQIVGEWLKTWGKPGRLPFKEWLAQRDG
jgi:hypothetical protein